MDFTFVLPIICINTDGQTNLKWIRPKLAILFLQKMYKNGYTYISVRVFFESVPHSKAYNSGYD